MSDNGPCNCDQALALQERVDTLEVAIKLAAQLLGNTDLAHELRKHVTCAKCGCGCAADSFILNERPHEPHCVDCKASS